MTPMHAENYRGRITLVGFGAIFDSSLIQVLDGWEQDEFFLREADRVFTALNPHVTVFPEIQILPCASAENRLWRQADHIARFMEIEKRINRFNVAQALHSGVDWTVARVDAAVPA
jgi:hypothetical protein